MSRPLTTTEAEKVYEAVKEAIKASLPPDLQLAEYTGSDFETAPAPPYLTLELSKDQACGLCRILGGGTFGRLSHIAPKLTKEEWTSLSRLWTDLDAVLAKKGVGLLDRLSGG